MRKMPATHAIAAAAELNDDVSRLQDFWRTSVAGTALRAMVAEAQATRDGQPRLRQALSIYSDAFRAAGHDAATAEASVAPRQW